MNENSKKKSEFGKRIIGLDIVRTVAVLAVVVHHFSRTWWEVAFAPLVLAGIYGVELFFVLSGFLIGGILFRQAERSGFHRKDVLHFWTRRWFRTLPNYVLFLVLFALIEPIPNTKLETWWRYLFFLQNFWSSDHLIFYRVSWSLCVEEWTYILLPLIFLALARLLRNYKAAALGAIAILVVVPLVLQIVGANEMRWDFDNRIVAVYRISAIGIGVLLAYIRNYHENLMARLARPAALWVGFLLLFLLGADWANYCPDHKVIHMVFSGALGVWMNGFWFLCVDVAMLLFVSALSNVHRIGKRAGNRLEKTVLAISLYSYSMYLVHILILDNFDMLRTQYYFISPEANFLAFLLYFLLTIVAAAVIYRYYEEPLTNLRNKVSP